MYRVFLVIIIFSNLFSNQFESWLNLNSEIFNYNYKSVSFQISMESEIGVGEKRNYFGKITLGKKKEFRFEMGPRITVSDGKKMKIYDNRTNQIFIQKSNKQMERILFSWTKLEKLRKAQVKIISEGKYELNFFGTNDNIQVFFNINSNLLDSILVYSKNGIFSKIYNIDISFTDTLILDVGSNDSEIFDLR